MEQNPGRPSLENTFSITSLIEVAAVVLTGVLHLVLVNAFKARAVFIGLSLFGWVLYIAMRIRKEGRLIGAWGFSKENLRSALNASTIVAVAGMAVMFGLASVRGSLSISWHMVPLLLFYPIWGFIQQFLVQALVVGNLSRAHGVIGSWWMLTLISAVLFATVHLPDLALSFATLLLGFAFTPIYLRWRNLWPLGLYHGWLGVFMYFWVLKRDPWMELLSSL